MPSQTILIVEDNAGFAETLAEVLSSRGFETHWVTTPESARSIAEQRRFDLMIIDHGLDVHSGLDVAREFAAENLIDRVVFLTGRISMSERDIPENLSGRSALLHKPVEMDDLVRTIRSILPA